MPVGTPFHERTLALCESLNYREWSGYYTVSVYEMHHEHEYNAIRNSAALIDISPLYKYRVTGPDATRLVNRIITRDINKVAVDQVIYCCWCDSEGKVIDDALSRFRALRPANFCTLQRKSASPTSNIFASRTEKSPAFQSTSPVRDTPATSATKSGFPGMTPSKFGTSS